MIKCWLWTKAKLMLLMNSRHVWQIMTNKSCLHQVQEAEGEPAETAAWPQFGAALQSDVTNVSLYKNNLQLADWRSSMIYWWRASRSSHGQVGKSEMWRWRLLPGEHWPFYQVEMLFHYLMIFFILMRKSY